MENLDSGAWVAAVVAPWAVAPHPNFSQESVTGPGLLALVAQFRLKDMDRYEAALPDGSPPWVMDLVRAARKSILVESVRSGADELWAIANLDAAPPTARVAAAIFAAVAEVELDEHNRAVEGLLNVANDLRTLTSSVNGVALSLVHQQVAARQFELFEYDAAMESLARVSDYLALDDRWDAFPVSLGISWNAEVVEGDVRTAISDHCLELRARIEGFQGTAWVDVVKSRSSWPDQRSEASSAARDRKFVEQTFEQWIGSRGKRRVWSNRDPIITPALESLLAAELSGDVNAFMQRRESLAQLRILRNSDNPDSESIWEVQDSLRLLRRSRSRESLKRALDWIYLQGPDSALQRDASTILQRDGFPHDVSAFDLLVLSAAAPYLSPESIASSMDSALSFLTSPRGAPGSRPEDERTAWSAVVRLLEESNRHDEVAKKALDAAKKSSFLQLIEGDLVRLLDTLDWDAVESEVVTGWVTWGQENYDQTDAKDLAHRAIHVKKSVDHNVVLQGLSGMDQVLYLLRHKDDFRAVPPETVLVAETVCLESLARIREEANNGATSFGSTDSGEVSTIFAHMYSRPLVWEAVAAMLTDPRVARELKERALDRIADYGSEAVPETVQASLRSNWMAVLESENVEAFFSDSNAEPKFAEAIRAGAVLKILTRDDAIATVTALAGSRVTDDRTAAAEILPDAAAAHGDWEWAQLLLLQLTQDSNATVRSQASRGLAWVGTRQTGISPLVRAALTESLQRGGIRTPLLTLHGFQRLNTRGNWLEYGDEIVSLVKNMSASHPARVVRRAATQVLRRSR